MPITLIQSYTPEESYLETYYRKITEDMWATLPEEELLEFLDGFLAIEQKESIYEGLIPYNLEHRQGVFNGMRDTVLKAAKNRNSIALMERALRISDKLSEFILGWVLYKESTKRREKERIASFQKEIAERSVDQLAVAAQFL